MKFALIAKDKPGALEVRKANRDAHLAYIKDTGVVSQAGPLLDAEGQMCGSLVILEVADMAAAQAWASGDPYGHAGLFASVELIAWNRVIGG
ncbi:MAG: YciI family protein [Roseivivax sp.]|nr:YciI family protein [Roseivivax sp.]